MNKSQIEAIGSYEKKSKNEFHYPNLLKKRDYDNKIHFISKNEKP
ncbi:hypothetical protein ACFQ1R_10080 [Mariniflexile jejuense]|uniref:Uncharacterized protein n=1 Tax=Mariniflexile jejuense TaxID=1173582 RepID=A0ABW3JJ90_9FLAO